jgi:hypothetical protein
MYQHVVSGVIKQVIVHMVTQGRKTDNEALQTSAGLVNQFVFGKADFEPHTKLSDDKDDVAKPENTQVNDERTQWLNERFEVARDELNTRVNNVIKSTIEQNMDPKDSMGSYVKNAAVREALEKVQSSLTTDKRFKTIIDRLWENAVKAKFSKDSTDKIRSAYVSRARTLLPTVIKSVRNEALKGIGKRVRDDSNEPEDKKESRINKPRTSTPPRNEGRQDRNSAKGKTALEFLMED